MPSYVSYQLVYAHNPSQSSLSTSTPELRIPTEREHPSSSQLSSLTLHPEHASAVYREPTRGVTARLIQNGYCLELSTFSLKAAQTSQDGSDRIRIFFPDSLHSIEGCVVPSKRDGRLYILVVSTSNVLYRLNFPLTSTAVSENLYFKLDSKDEWCEEWSIPEDVLGACGGISCLTVTNEDNVVLGCDDGGIIRLTRAGHWRNGSWSATHHRASSRYRLPSLFSRSTSPDEQIISLAEYEHEDQLAIVYSLSRDRKLRSWNAATGASIKTVDVRISTSTSTELVVRSPQAQPASSSSTPPLPYSTVPLLHIIPHPSQSSRFSHLVVVFIASPHSSTSPGTFAVYRANNGTNDLTYAGERPASDKCVGAEFRGFNILPPFRKDGFDIGWRIWSTWDLKGETTCETSVVDDLFQFTTYVDTPESRLLGLWQTRPPSLDTTSLDAAYFDNILPLEPPELTEPYENSDISETFISHMFLPGRFSILSLTTVLDEYIAHVSKQYHHQDDLQVYPTLSSRYTSTIGTRLHMQINQQTGAPEVEAYRRALKLEWLGVWARLRDLDRQARWPVSTTILDQEIVIFSREGVSVPVVDDCTGLPWAAEGNTLFTEGSLRKSYPALAAPGARSARMLVNDAGSDLASCMEISESEEGISYLKEFQTSLDAALSAGIQGSIEDSFGSLWDDHVDPCLQDEERAKMASWAVSDIRRGVQLSVDILSNFMTSFEGSPSDTGYSGIGLALITSNINRIVQSRYLSARNLVIVSVYLLSESLDISSEDEDSEDLILLLSKVLSIFHRYEVLKMLCEARAGNAASLSKGSKRKQGGDELADGFGDLKVQEEGQGNDYDATYSVIHSLLARQIRPELPTDSTSLSSIASSTMRILQGLGLVDYDVIDIQARIPDVKLASMVLANGHSPVAGQLTELYPMSPGMAYVKARACLGVGEIEEAITNFELAAGAFEGLLADGVLSNDKVSTLADYYKDVSKLFDDHSAHQAVVHFGKRAIKALPPNVKSSRDIWTRIFLSQVALGVYEEAYSTLTSSPFSDLTTEFLGQLISVMCEHNQVGRLNSLGFVGFQDKVEEMLKFKARNSDPLRFPNYYKVLYSWHISRGNYRSAGEIMYLQGRRLGDSTASGSKLPPFELSAMQARSYLAAINALSLVDKRNAWVSVPSTAGRSRRGLKRRKMSSYVPEDEFTQEKRSIDLITLRDIKMEYTLVLSHLRLSTYIKDLQEHGVTISPEEVVGLFTQRGLFDIAFSSAVALDVDMSDIFQNLASRCVEVSRLSPEQGAASTLFLKASPQTASLRGPPSLLLLRYLQLQLRKYDSSKTHFRYTSTVSQTFFELNPDKNSGWKMPDWLVSGEMQRDPEGWIGLGLEWGWIDECVGWCVDLLGEVTPPELLSNKSNVAYLPYNLFDRIIAATQEGDEAKDETLQKRVTHLKKEIDRRVEGLKKIY